jgi:hypothetical protein
MTAADSTQLLETRNTKLETDFARETQNAKLETDFAGFALADCLIQTDPQTEKYLRRVIRTAFELAVYNRFGAEIGGFWLMTEQIEQLRKLPEYYSPNEAVFVANAVEIYLYAQLNGCYEAALG